MKVGIHTVDLFPGRERLMPFRTTLEVAEVMLSCGWQADVLNSSVSEYNAEDFTWHNINIIQCPRDFNDLSEWINQRGYDVFIFAATIREGLRNLYAFRNIKCRKIAYIPSGITPKWNAFQLFRYYGTLAKAWLLEAMTPKTLIASKLKKVGFTDIIGLTEYTTQKIGHSLSTHTIYPGKDDFENIKVDEDILKSEGLKGEKFYLFTGAPGQVRGSLLLLKAFDKFINKARGLSAKPKIVFLMRNDVGAKYESFFKTLDSLHNKDCVTVICKNLSISQLKAFMSEAYAVILPFICIPAEIPITYYEVMSCGTPVISFNNAGTTKYLKKGLKTAGLVSISNLSKALLDLWINEKEQIILARNASEIMKKHPTWDKVGKQWMNVILNKQKK